MATESAVLDGPWVPLIGTFSDRIYMVRKRCGWNAAEAAQECGISKQTWRNWEDGHQPQNLEAAARKISRRTGADYIWLMTGEVTNPSGTQLLTNLGTREDYSRAA